MSDPHRKRAADVFVLPPDYFSRSDEDRVAWIRELKEPKREDQRGFRRTVLWIIDDTRDARAIDALTEIVRRDESVDVRRSALRTLGGTRDAAAIPGLLCGLEFNDLPCKESAIIGLKKLKAREAVPALIGLLENDERHDFSQIRVTAAEALVAIRDERALAPIRDASKRGSLLSRRKLRRCMEDLASVLGDSGIRPAGDA